MEFPATRPQASNYVHPRDGETTTLSPPGFSWWRAGERGECTYRLIVRRDGQTQYTSPETADPIHLPDEVFPAGDYTWYVEALTGDSVAAKSETNRFTIREEASEQPWVSPQLLLNRIPREHPRVLFLADHLTEVRSTLTTTRAESFGQLKQMADEALSIEPIPEPDYDQIEDPAERRLAYSATFHATRKVHDQGMRALALTYLLTGEKQFGEHARELIVDAAKWDPEGISSILAPYGDEVGLGLLRVGAEVYDWIYDLFSDDERALVAGMVGARADQMIRQLERSDYTFKPEGSHNGRLPGFLLEHAIALAEDERAADWAEYALKIIGTNFPHWAGQDGGWAQGVPYGMSYNTRDATPFHAWQLATDHDIWLKPFYKNLPWFFYYAVSPIGEIMPFGDTEHQQVRPSGARTLMYYHALRLRDGNLRRWADQVATQGGEEPKVDPFPAIVCEDNLDTTPPDPLPNDRVFRGVGWAALHSDIAHPREDFMVAFRSSPYGGVSHGHASQNDFAIMKGGRALICAGGERFPHHGTPFHNEYAQQSISHNCVLVNGVGAVNRDGNRGGVIHDYQTLDHIGYVCGEAENAYDDLTRYRRHMVMIRPSVLILVDELEAAQSSIFQWLLHAFEKFEIDTSTSTIVSRRGGATLTGRLASSSSLALSQTDAWPIAPDEGYPTLTKPLPDPRWHFTAETEEAAKCRIVSVFTVQGPEADEPEVETQVSESAVRLAYTDNDRNHSCDIQLDPESSSVLTIDNDRENVLQISS
jgi:hypothetical protein